MEILQNPLRYIYKGIQIYSDLDLTYNFTFLIGNNHSEYTSSYSLEDFINVVDSIFNDDIFYFVMNHTFHEFNALIYSLVNLNGNVITSSKGPLSWGNKFKYEYIPNGGSVIIHIYIRSDNDQTLTIKTINSLGNDLKMEFILGNKTVNYRYCMHHYLDSKNNECEQELCDEIVGKHLAITPVKSARLLDISSN